ncbi:MAG TPA: hypothetical protein VID48_09365 [Solirubrobacteraceae bacterium]
MTVGGPSATHHEYQETPALRSVTRPRRYLAHHWLVLLTPLLRYSATRDAYVLRAVGGSKGPVLRVDRRRRQLGFDGIDRRTSAA